MTEYLIAFNDEWTPEFTPEQLREAARTSMAVIEDMKAAGVYVYANGGLVRETPVFHVRPVDGEPVFTDGPYVESKELFGGFTVIDVPDEEAARLWAGRIAIGCGWPQEVRPFPSSSPFD
ncbi:YciI family protein [Microbacterium rhizophilus]|uniref:YciI family protein n=1 Tax=Microbacterium rhizophilus TaxID=3138934 RepID=UPI0031E7F591